MHGEHSGIDGEEGALEVRQESPHMTNRVAIDGERGACDGEEGALDVRQESPHIANRVAIDGEWEALEVRQESPPEGAAFGVAQGMGPGAKHLRRRPCLPRAGAPLTKPPHHLEARVLSCLL